MTPERVGTSSTVEETTGALRPKSAAWLGLATFAKRQPLGALGALVAIVLILVALFAPLIATHDPRETNVGEFKFAGPGTELWLGGDQLGRDVFSRLVYGARISLLVGILSVVFGVTVGFAIGIVSAYFGGKTDLYVQRIMDAMIAFPALILALAIMADYGCHDSLPRPYSSLGDHGSAWAVNTKRNYCVNCCVHTWRRSHRPLRSTAY